MTISNYMQDNLYTYVGFSLIDITPSKANTGKHRDQQRNWETISQLLSLRTQLLRFEPMGSIITDVSNYQFGINYEGHHKIWMFKFAVEYADVYAKDNDRYGALKEDFAITPVILGLDETAKCPVPLFYPSGPYKNIYFKSLSY